MIPAIVARLLVKEAFEDTEDAPTVVLHGPSDIGPITIHLKGKGLNLTGVTIGQEVTVSLDKWLRWVVPQDADADQPRAR